MHVITVTGHEPGDYLHPDQKLEIIDEATGHRYDLYLRGNALASTQGGEVSLFIPTPAIREIQTDQEYCVLTLSAAATPGEVEERRQRLAGIYIDPGREAGRTIPAAKRRARRSAADSSRSS